MKKYVLNVMTVCLYSCLGYPACSVILSSVASPAVQHFSTLSHKRHDFRKRKNLSGNKMCV